MVKTKKTGDAGTLYQVFYPRRIILFIGILFVSWSEGNSRTVPGLAVHVVNLAGTELRSYIFRNLTQKWFCKQLMHRY